MTDTPLISIVVPYIRPDKFARCEALIHQNAGYPRYELLSYHDEQRIGCPRGVAALTEVSRGSLVAFLGDDTLPQPGFLQHAMDCMATLPDRLGLVGFNDCSGRDLPTHWLADKRLLPLLGGEFFHTAYQHCCCDRELHERCAALGRYKYCLEAVVLHDHPIFTGSVPDADYIRVYSDEVRGADRALLAERRAAGWP